MLLVSHGAPIGAIHEIFYGKWKYVGQATVSKFVQTKDGKFLKELSSDDSHLSDKSNLRPWCVSFCIYFSNISINFHAQL